MKLFQKLDDGHVQMTVDLDKVFGQPFDKRPFLDGILIKITFKKKPHCTGMFCIRVLKSSDYESTIDDHGLTSKIGEMRTPIAPLTVIIGENTGSLNVENDRLT